MADAAGRRKEKAAKGEPRRRAGGRLHPENRELLRWLDSWLASPDGQGDAWWSEFEADLRRDRAGILARRP